MQYICSKTGDEGSICAARQGMRACNNSNMCNPIITHVSIVACPHPLSWCTYTALIPYLAAYMLHLFSNILALSSLHPSTFNGNVSPL